MNSEFDFDKIGKQTPYKVPAGFFDEITTRTLEKAKERERKSKIRRIYAAVSVAASLLIVVSFAIVLNVQQQKQQPENVVVADPVKTEKPVVDSVFAKSAEDVKTEEEAEKPVVEKPETIDNLLAEMTDEELGQLADDLNDELFVDELTND
ncbi:MAG: hypothetical protein AB7S72_06110 [Draconibacterium sp.]